MILATNLFLSSLATAATPMQAAQLIATETNVNALLPALGVVEEGMRDLGDRFQTSWFSAQRIALQSAHTRREAKRAAEAKRQVAVIVSELRPETWKRLVSSQGWTSRVALLFGIPDDAMRS